MIGEHSASAAWNSSLSKSTLGPSSSLSLLIAITPLPSDEIWGSGMSMPWSRMHSA